MTISAHIPNTTNAAAGTVRFTGNDAQELPPFVALDVLDAAVTDLDAWCSNFIGRMQPYCNQMGMATLQQMEKVEKRLDLSGLEDRIGSTTERVMAVLAALDAMNETLRL